jgi:hypothetical protein
VRQPALPVSRNQFCDLLEGVDVTGQSKRDNIRGETVNDRPRLFAGATVRLLDGDIVARFAFLVVSLERSRRNDEG